MFDEDFLEKQVRIVEKKKLDTVEKYIFWAYANLAMAHSAIEKNQKEYSTVNYTIRAKMFKGLSCGEMNIHSLFDDEKLKLRDKPVCSYCGSHGNLTLDHILPRNLNGGDDPGNLISSCRSCNSSKGSLDMMEWMYKQKRLFPLMTIRRYIKLMVLYLQENDLFRASLDLSNEEWMPFKLQYLPLKYPAPKDLILFYQ